MAPETRGVSSPQRHRTLSRGEREGRIRLCVPAIIASERQRGPLLTNFSQFEERLSRAGIPDAEVLPTLARLDLTYYDSSVLADEQMAALEAAIHRVLFAEHEFDYGPHADALGLVRDGELEPG